VKIAASVHGGTDWTPSVRRLHLGGKGANNVDSIHFVLPDEWAALPVNLVVQWKDGNEVDAMRTAKQKLQEYLIQR
jgi:hypothetical protein